MAVTVVTMEPAHWEDVRRIYAEGLATGQATFETDVPGREAWDRAHLPRPRVVALEGGEPCGWAALSPVSPRRAYSGVAEVSTYVAASRRGRGVGTALLRELVRRAEEAGFWTLQASVFPENAASVALHERCGFRRVGVRERIGRLGGVWHDVVLYERRSRVTSR